MQRDYLLINESKCLKDKLITDILMHAENSNNKSASYL